VSSSWSTFIQISWTVVFNHFTGTNIDIFEPFPHAIYIGSKGEFMERGESSGPLLESNVSLIREECHVCTKETWITEWLFAGPRVVTPKLHAQLALWASVLTGNDQFNGYFSDLTDRRPVQQVRGVHGLVPSVHKFYTYLVATYKFYAPQWWHIASSTLTLSKVLYVFVPCIVIQLCNKKQQNTQFYVNALIQLCCLLHVSNNNVHSQEELYMQFLWHFFHSSIWAV